MFSLKSDWMICDVISIGKSGGLLASWDTNCFDLVLVLSVGGIFLTGSSL
jgi:hypothetical protein